jgi:hypothetical protein
MQLGAISSLLSTLPEMWRWTTAGLQYRARDHGETWPTLDPAPKAAPTPAWGGSGLTWPAKTLMEPLSRLTTAEGDPARFDGQRESNGNHRLGSLQFKLFILLTSQIENFGLTECRAKVLVSGQQGSGLLKSAEGHENNEEGCFYAIAEAMGIQGI